MKAIILKASDNNFYEEREVNSLANLKAIWDEYDEELIVNFDEEGEEVYITIYDDYIE